MLRVIGARHNRVKGQLRGGADDLFELSGRADAGHLNENAVGALTLDRGLAGANFVDAATHDLQRLPHGAVVGGELFRFAQLNGQDITI